MGDNVDVKALRARFAETQALKVPPGGGASPRLLPLGHTSEFSANGGPRNKTSPVIQRLAPPLNSTNEPKRYGQPPLGLFPKPPPSHRAGAKEEHKAPLTEPELPGRVRQTGEFLQNKMLRHHDDRKIQSSPRPALPNQRSMCEVPPLRKPLPSVGQRPSKPKRPPSVNLDHFRKKAPPLRPQRQETKTSQGPGRPPNKPTMLASNKPTISIEQEQDTYEPVDLPPPPPPPPKPSSRDSYTGSFSSQADEESEKSDIYEEFDEENQSQPQITPKIHKRQQVLEKKEQKEKQKKENEYRKKFKLKKEEEVLHIARVREDWHGGKNDLRVMQGETVEIVRIKNNPEGKWLARNMNREYGYISNNCVDVDYEEVKRKLRLVTAPPSFIPSMPQEEDDIYDDVDAHNSSLNSGGDVYDDVEIPDDFPLPPPEISHDPKRSKQQEKEEKELRKNFKFKDPIKVLYCMMVDPNANIKKGDSKTLRVVQGQILEVIQETNEKKVLCRNEKGKYGYVPRSYLLQAEFIYDDVDRADIYDNDANVSGPLRP